MRRSFHATGVLGIFVSALFSPLILLSADQPVNVKRVAVAAAVENREPVGEAREFEASTGKVYCWTSLTAVQPPVVIKHVWYKNGQKVLEVPLTIKTSTCRTWSNKNISPGDWKVEIASEDGAVLSSTEFKVK